MKKTISSTISGVIFHIEEDGYDKLKQYLSSIQQYFSGYEDSREIITDIENRIAEKFLARLKAENRQVVTIDDVNELIASMGTVADFEAVEEEEVLVGHTARASRPQPVPTPLMPEGSSTNPNDGGASSQTQTGPAVGNRPLIRDLNHKMLGGVASGLAYYFNMDVVWMRLILVAMVIGFPSLLGISNIHAFESLTGTLSGLTVLLYIAMWIALPGRSNVEEDKSVKKFYRNPDNKVVGGVASGIAAYFGIDVGLVRLLFVVSICLFGVGFLLYLVLWAISPAAHTLTEKMEMQGEPITLTNIENSIRQKMNETPGRESDLTRVLLFPFRAIAMIIAGLGRALGPSMKGLVSLIRVLAGVVLLVLALSGTIACMATVGAAMGLGLGLPLSTGGLPIEMFRADVTPPLILAGAVVGLIPCIALGVLGMMLITNRPVISTRAGLTLAGIWLLGILFFSAMVTPLIRSFQRRGTVEQTQTLQVAGNVPLLTVKDDDEDMDWHPNLELEGYNGTAYTLEQRFQAQGATREEAQENARMIDYRYTVQDSTITFDRSLLLKDEARFRGQDLRMTLRIPYGKRFRMTENFARFIDNRFSQKELDRMQNSVWFFTEADGLVCVNGPRDRANDADDDNGNNDVSNLLDNVQNAVAAELGDDFNEIGEHTRQFNVNDFDALDVSGAFVVRVIKGDTYKVVADGDKDDLDNVEVEVKGGVLNVSMNRRILFDTRNHKRMGITITMPTIKTLKLSGASKGRIADFGRFDHLAIDLSGASRAQFDGQANHLTVDLSGASSAVLQGQAQRVEADLGGASKLQATDMTIDEAKVDAEGASRAELGQVRSLDSETSGASKVTRQ